MLVFFLMVISCLCRAIKGESKIAALASPCPTAGYTSSSGVLSLTSSCSIAGDVVLSGTAELQFISGGSSDNSILTIYGNLILSGSAVFSMVDGELNFPQTSYSQFYVTLYDNAKFIMYGSRFVTNADTDNNYSMSLNGKDLSITNITNSALNTNTGSWLLGNFFNNATLIMSNSDQLPTEIYSNDASYFSLEKHSSFSTVWINFNSDTISQFIQPTKSSSSPYFNFSFGPNVGNNVRVRISDCSNCGRLGLNSYPGSSLSVKGNGGDESDNIQLVFGYYLLSNPSPATVDEFVVGSNLTLTYGPDYSNRLLQLTNVYLNPFTWQIYCAYNNALVTIKNSLINELGVFTNGNCAVVNSVFQYAVLGAEAAGAKLSISDSQIWSQVIQAANGGQVTLNNTEIHGNLVSSSGAGSKITIVSTNDLHNGNSTIQNCNSNPTTGFPPNQNGIPLCSPFYTLHRCAQYTNSSGGIIVGFAPCEPYAAPTLSPTGTSGKDDGSSSSSPSPTSKSSIGVIFGIVVACIAFLFIVSAAIKYFKKRSTSLPSQSQDYSINNPLGSKTENPDII